MDKFTDKQNIIFYFAPLEGVTNYLFRNAYDEIFGCIDTYFSPFVTPKSKKSLRSHDSNDIHPDNNKVKKLVPQILTNNADDFILTANTLKELGYNTVNLNLGCPSGTVFSKGKGSGFLAFQPELERFLDKIYALSEPEISIKTRVGVDYEEEWYELLPIFNRYPIKELIIHPRLRSDFYSKKIRIDLFDYAEQNSVNPIVYNGDLFTTGDIEQFILSHPNIQKIMLGRGIIANPALIRQLLYGKALKSSELLLFHNKMLTGYEKILFGDRAILFKMKELWSYWQYMFDDSTKYIKNIRKSQKLYDYRNAVNLMFNNCHFNASSGFKSTE